MKGTEAQELVKLEGQKTTLLATTSKDIAIATDEELAGAVDFLAKARLLKKETEGIRQFFVRPLNAHVATINGQFKDFLLPVEEAEAIINKAIQVYRQFLQKQADEKQLLLQKEAEEEHAKGDSLIPEVVASIAKGPDKKIVTTIGTVGFTEHWSFEIVDEALIPREYLSIDTTKIGQVVRAMKADTNIPGIKVIRMEVPVARNRTNNTVRGELE